MTRSQKRAALAGLRFAVKGWAFTAEERLPSMLAHCESIAATLPAELAVDANEILAPLREAVSCQP